jgi:tripartite-type tricarboxylate transporter receptor subunit TctC
MGNDGGSFIFLITAIMASLILSDTCLKGEQRMQQRVFRSSRRPTSSVQGDAKSNRSFPVAAKFLLVILLLTISAHGVLLANHAAAQTPFYQGKTVKIVVAATPGGTGDFRVRALVPYLRKYIPGNPTVILEFMDGSGGRKAANYIYANARPDGLTLGALSGGVIALSILGETGVMYDADKFVYLGSSESVSHQILYTRRELGLDTIEKLRAASGIRIGAQSVGHVAYVAARFFGYFLNLKDPKFIAGYTAPEVDAALLRGELDARSNNPTSVVRRNPDWVEKGLMHFHSILEAPKGAKFPRFAHLPEIETFAKSEREIKLLSVWRSFRLLGSPYVLPPGTPNDRVKILEEAMVKAFKDRDFYKEYEKIVGDDADPIMPDAMARVVKETPRDSEVIDTLKKLSGAGPLPPRL